MKAASREAESAQRPGYIRWPLMIALVIVLINAYWWNFEKRMTEIQAKTSFLDQSGQWTEPERKALSATAKYFRDQWGLKLLVHVVQPPLELPDISGSTLFIGLAPEKGQAIIVLPQLPSQALKVASHEAGYDLRARMERDLVICSQTSASSAPCVMQTLDALSDIFNK